MNGSDVVEIKEVDENYLSMFHIGLLSGEPFVKRLVKILFTTLWSMKPL